MGSQKKPISQVAFRTGAETNINLAIRRLTESLNLKKTYNITFYPMVERRVSQDNKVFPALFQSKSEDNINLLPGDMQVGYGFFDGDEPTRYEPMKPDGEATRNRFSIIKRNVSLIIYGNMDKLIAQKGTTNLDYRYFKQIIQDEVVKILMRETPLMNGFFDLKNIYQKDIVEIFKGFTVSESDSQFIQYPMFGFRFEGEITVKEKIC